MQIAIFNFNLNDSHPKKVISGLQLKREKLNESTTKWIDEDKWEIRFNEKQYGITESRRKSSGADLNFY